MKTNVKSIVLTVIAVSAGLVVASVVYQLVASRNVQAEPQQQTLLPRVVARTPIEAGAVLTEKHLKTSQLPAQSASGDFSKPKSLIGRVAGSSITQDDPITEDHLLPLHHRSFIREQVKKGYRGIWTKVNIEAGYPQIMVGDRVDVVAVTQEPPKAQILIQNAEVLSFPAPPPEQYDDSYRRQKKEILVALALKPADAEKMALGTSGTRKIILLLRGYEDETWVQTDGTTAEHMLPIDLEKKLNAHKVEIIKGQTRNIHSFHKNSAGKGSVFYRTPGPVSQASPMQTQEETE
jgi:Flp pilus assembly protein CpaB